MLSQLVSALLCLGASSCALPSQEIVASGSEAFAPAPAAPNFRLSFTAYIKIDTGNPRPIVTPDGVQLNAAIKGGNWTAPNGDLLATVIPGIGGELGYTDSKGVFQVDGRYVVEFASDNKFASVTLGGTGVAGRSNQAYATIVTDSTSNRALTRQKLYAPGKIISGILIAPHWAPVVFS